MLVKEKKRGILGAEFNDYIMLLKTKDYMNWQSINLIPCITSTEPSITDIKNSGAFIFWLKMVIEESKG